MLTSTTNTAEASIDFCCSMIRISDGFFTLINNRFCADTSCRWYQQDWRAVQQRCSCCHGYNVATLQRSGGSHCSVSTNCFSPSFTFILILNDQRIQVQSAHIAIKNVTELPSQCGPTRGPALLLIWTRETERESHPELQAAELFHSGSGQRKQTVGVLSSSRRRQPRSDWLLHPAWCFSGCEHRREAILEVQ